MNVALRWRARRHGLAYGYAVGLIDLANQLGGQATQLVVIGDNIQRLPPSSTTARPGSHPAASSHLRWRPNAGPCRHTSTRDLVHSWGDVRLAARLADNTTPSKAPALVSIVFLAIAASNARLHPDWPDAQAASPLMVALTAGLIVAPTAYWFLTGSHEA